MRRTINLSFYFFSTYKPSAVTIGSCTYWPEISSCPLLTALHSSSLWNNCEIKVDKYRMASPSSDLNASQVLGFSSSTDLCNHKFGNFLTHGNAFFWVVSDCWPSQRCEKSKLSRISRRKIEEFCLFFSFFPMPTQRYFSHTWEFTFLLWWEHWNHCKLWIFD